MSKRLFLLLPLAALLWCWPLGWSLWPDEVFTAGVVVRDIRGMIQGAANDRHPPLYYLFVSLFGFLGKSDAALRLPSAVALLSMLAVGLGSVRRWGTEGTAWVMALVLVFSPVCFLFAHTARMYALLAAFGAMLLAGCLGVAKGSRWGLLFLLVGGLGSLYTHYAGAGGVAGALAGSFLVAVQLKRRDLIGGTLIVGMAIGLCFAPWALGPLQQQLAEKSNPTQRSWTVLLYLLWGADPRIFVGSWGMLCLALVGCYHSRAQRWLWPWWGAMLLFPVLASSSEPAQNPRNYIGFLPMSAYLVAEGIAYLRLKKGLRGAWVDYAPVMLLLWPLLELSRQETNPQDVGNGHDYRREAQLLDRLIPADANLRFEPSYVVNQFSRYAPALALRSGGGEQWLGKATGAPRGNCTFLSAFRVALIVPEEACDEAVAVLRKEAEQSDYSPFLVEIGRRALEAKNLEEAESFAARAVQGPQRHFAAWDLVADVAFAQGDLEGALKATDQALGLARGWGFGANQIAGLWDQRARILTRQENAAAAQQATAAGACARSRHPAWLCGGVFSWLSAEESAREEGGAPAEKPAAGGGRGDWKDLEVRPLPQRWDFDEVGLSKGWVRTGFAENTGGELVVGDSKAEIDVACTPILAVPGPMKIQLRWTPDILSLDPPTWSVVELRPVQQDGKPLPDVEVARYFATRQGQPAREEEGLWTPPAGVSYARLCVKTGGASAGSTKVDWLSLTAG